MNIRNTNCYLGVTFCKKCYMFGDNVSVYNSDSMPHDKLHRRHIDLSLHRVREVIAAGVISFRFLAGKDNSADILSKHWAY